MHGRAMTNSVEADVKGRNIFVRLLIITWYLDALQLITAALTSAACEFCLVSDRQSIGACTIYRCMWCCRHARKMFDLIDGCVRARTRFMYVVLYREYTTLLLPCIECDLSTLCVVLLLDRCGSTQISCPLLAAAADPHAEDFRFMLNVNCQLIERHAIYTPVQTFGVCRPSVRTKKAVPNGS
jgi:hypothetical protein